MKNSYFKTSSVLPSIFGFIALFVYAFQAMSQTPQDVPHPDDSVPLDLNDPTNIVFFIIIPLLFVMLFVWLWKKRKRDNKKK